MARTAKGWEPEAMVADSRFAEIWDALGADERAEVAARMRELVAENRDRLEPKVRGHLCNLFFSLALLDVQGRRGIPEQDTIDAIASCMERYVQPKRRQMEGLFAKRWLWPALRLAIPRLMRGTSGANFQITDAPAASKNEIAFDCVRCPFKDLTARYGHPALGPAFCHVDEVIYGHLPGVRFEREGTLARGAGRCDFRFVREG